jgi:hypothetical protein
VRKFGRSGFGPSAVLEMHLVWVKGEVFRETFRSLTIVKVRKYRTKTAFTGRKSPAGAAESVRASGSQKSNGEIFQDHGGCDQKCPDLTETGVKVRLFGSIGGYGRVLKNANH